jgi:outer membrane protein assembly factor BamB
MFSNRVVMATSGGTLVMLSADEGKLIWQQELGKNCYASPVLAAGHIYALDLGGVMHVIEAGDEYKEVGGGPLGEMAGATPAFVEGRMYMRGGKMLVCVGE